MIKIQNVFNLAPTETGEFDNLETFKNQLLPSLILAVLDCRKPLQTSTYDKLQPLNVSNRLDFLKSHE